MFLKARESAINAVIADPNLMLIVVPIGDKKVWAIINTSFLTAEELSYIINSHIDGVAKGEDVYDCHNCGKPAVAFENFCSYCGAYPHLEEDENA